MGLLGSKTKIRSKSLVAGPQQNVLRQTGTSFSSLSNAIRDQIASLVGEVAPGVSDIRRSSISDIGRDTGIAREAFLDQAKGEPTFTFDPTTFEQQFTSPMMQSFRQFIEPVVRENLAFGSGSPGSFYSSNVGRGVGSAAQEFYTQNVLPQIMQAMERDFIAGESAAERRLQAATGLTQLPAIEAEAASSIETALLNNILSSLGLSTQFATTPTVENVVKQGSSALGDIMSAGSSLAGAGMMSSAISGAGGAGSAALLAGAI